MNGVIELKDGKTFPVVREEDLLYLVEEYMGSEAKDAMSELLGDAFLQGVESTNDEAEARYEELKEKYEELEARYEELKERRIW